MLARGSSDWSEQTITLPDEGRGVLRIRAPTCLSGAVTHCQTTDGHRPCHHQPLFKYFIICAVEKLFKFSAQGTRVLHVLDASR